MNVNFAGALWLNQPQSFAIAEDSVTIITEPNTDFWQRSYYGFSHDNAPALLLKSDLNFSFTTRVSFNYQNRFDQCGVIIYINSDNWFKASIEYEISDISRLGSVVTNHGYSDWATTDIPTPKFIWYRLSQRGADFLIESSLDGTDFQQMRIFHLHCLDETTEGMTQIDLLLPQTQPVQFGLYACSPLDSSFIAKFDGFSLQNSLWMAHI